MSLSSSSSSSSSSSHVVAESVLKHIIDIIVHATDDPKTNNLADAKAERERERERETEAEASTATTALNTDSDEPNTTSDDQPQQNANVICGHKRKRERTRWGAPPKKKRWGFKKDLPSDAPDHGGHSNRISNTNTNTNTAHLNNIQFNVNSNTNTNTNTGPHTTANPTTTTTTTNGNPRALAVNSIVSTAIAANASTFQNKRFQLEPHVTAANMLKSNRWTPQQTKILLLRMRLQETNTKLFNPAVYRATHKDEPQSPSPEPIYDTKGIRMNTREVRFQENAQIERNSIVRELLTLDQSFIPPTDYKPPKLTKRIDLPVDEFPDYNFFGLIVGPRGNTQKAMQRETGCKIAVRGHGATGDKPVHMLDPEDIEPLHVHITAPNQDCMDKATGILEKLIHEVKTGGSNHKNKQLMLWAEINGTVLKIETRCRVCGGLGHPIWKCPERKGAAWTPAQVQCAICGEMSHVTTDCKKFNRYRSLEDQEISSTHKTASIDEEYSQFMAELVGDAPLTSYKPMAAIEGPTSTSTSAAGASLSSSSTSANKAGIPVPVPVPVPISAPKNVRFGVKATYHSVPPPCQTGANPPAPRPQRQRFPTTGAVRQPSQRQRHRPPYPRQHHSQRSTHMPMSSSHQHFSHNRRPHSNMSGVQYGNQYRANNNNNNNMRTQTNPYMNNQNNSRPAQMHSMPMQSMATQMPAMPMAFPVNPYPSYAPQPAYNINMPAVQPFPSPMEYAARYTYPPQQNANNPMYPTHPAYQRR